MLSVSRRNGWPEARDRKSAGQAGTPLPALLPGAFSVPPAAFPSFQFLLLLPLALVVQDPIAVSVASTK